MVVMCGLEPQSRPYKELALTFMLHDRVEAQPSEQEISWSSPTLIYPRIAYRVVEMAESRGFEPRHPIKSLLAFQANPFSHLGNFPLDSEFLMLHY